MERQPDHFQYPGYPPYYMQAPPYPYLMNPPPIPTVSLHWKKMDIHVHS